MTDQTQVSFLKRHLGPAFVKRTVTIPPQTSFICAGPHQRDELIVIERGEVELEISVGKYHLFPEGSVLTLFGLRLSALHNNGDEDAVFIAVSRNP